MDPWKIDNLRTCYQRTSTQTNYGQLNEEHMPESYVGSLSGPTYRPSNLFAGGNGAEMRLTANVTDNTSK